VSHAQAIREKLFAHDSCNAASIFGRISAAAAPVPDYTRADAVASVGRGPHPLVDLLLDAGGALAILFEGTAAMALPEWEGGIVIVGIGFGNQQIEQTSVHGLVSNRMFSTLTKPVSVNPVGREEPLIVMVRLDVPLQCGVHGGNGVVQRQGDFASVLNFTIWRMNG
jgi:hypothetical protein